MPGSLRIGILSRWNATCGISLHAEMIGRELARAGHEVYVFAPYIESASAWWHHKIIGKDEPYVVRCYEELNTSLEGGWIDESKILSRRYDLFIVESYASIPHKHVERLARKLDCTKVVVVHEGSREELGYTDMSVFDYIVVFDERFLEILDSSVRSKVRVIPYPCNPVRRGSRRFAEDGLVFFSFGRQPASEYEDYIRALDWLSSKYDFVYRVIRSNGLLPVRRPWLEQVQMRIPADDLYGYLHSADIHLLPKGNTRRIVVSSTLCQCLGSLVPTVVPNTRHFEMVDRNAIVVYKSLEDLKRKLIMLVESEEYRNSIIRAAERYVEKNSVERVARMFLELAEQPLETTGLPSPARPLHALGIHQVSPAQSQS